jgi:hypothetical protein
MRLVFKNVLGTDVHIPTPNGAGRRVPVGKCVEGSFFRQLATAGLLQQITDEEIIESDIIFKYETAGFVYPKNFPTPPPIVESVVEPVVETVVEPEPVVAPVSLTPTEKDFYKMSLQEVQQLAAGAGIDYAPDTKKKELIKALVAKG